MITLGNAKKTFSRIKKRLMEMLWRAQASQSIIGIVLWSLMLAGVFYPYVRDKFNIDPKYVLATMTVLFLITVSAILLFGFMFDKLKFWKEQTTVIVERNPYTSYKLQAKELVWLRLWIQTAKCIPNKSKELEEQIKFFEQWRKKVMDDDPNLKKEVENVERFVGISTNYDKN